MSNQDIGQITVTVTGREDHLAKFVQLCKSLHRFGSLGCSRTIKVWYDGDGAARLKFDFGNTDVSQVQPVGTDYDGKSIDFE